jgi:hypothetical protein
MTPLDCSPEFKDAVGLAILGGYALIEWRMGRRLKTGRGKYGSVLDAIYNMVFKRKIEMKGDTMSIAKKELDYAKEVGEAMELAVKLVKEIKAGKTAAEMASGVLPEFMSAIQGIDQIPAEVKASKEVVMATVGYHVGELAGAMVG